MAGYIGSRASVVSSGAERKKTFDITGPTTVLTGLSYTPTFVHLFHNGVRLVDGTDYTATDSTSITLTTAAQSGDQVVVVSYATFQPSDTVSASVGGTFAGDVEVNGNLTVGGNVDINGGTIDGTVIGGTTPAAVTATALTVQGTSAIALVEGSTNARLRLKDTGAATDLKNIEFYSVNGRLEINAPTDDLATSKHRVNIGADGSVSLYDDTGTTPKFLWDASAESLGIGTSSPAFISGGGLHVHNSTVARVKVTNTTTGSASTDGSEIQAFEDDLYLVNREAAGKIVLNTNGADRVTVDASGNVGIGYSSGIEGKFSVSGFSVFVGSNGTTPPGNNPAIARISSSNEMGFFNGGSERMRFFSDGSKGHSYDTGATIKEIFNWSNNTTGMSFRSAGIQRGSIYFLDSGVSYNTTSDYRLKEDLQPVSDPIGRVMALNPVNFAWTESGTRVDGFIAHEAQEVVPEAVHGTKDAMREEQYEVSPAVYDDEGNLVSEAVMGTRQVPDYQGIDQSKLVPLLTAALQEALMKIDALEVQNAAFEARLAALEAV